VARNSGKPFEISPWALTWDDENYYMIGYDEVSGMVKHYRVDKMQKITMMKAARVSEESFRDFDLARFAKNTFGMYGGKVEQVTLECDDRLIGIMIDRFGTDVIVQKMDDSRFRIRHEVAVSGQFFGWIAGIGPGVKIVHPQYVAEAFQEHLKGILTGYVK